MGGNGLFAQITSDTNFREPAINALKKLEKIFNIVVIDDKDLLKDKMLKYAQWRVEPGNLEVSMANILAPFNLRALKKDDGTYNIREFQYHKVSENIAKERLSYLADLYHDKIEWEIRKGQLKTCMISSFGIDKAPKRPNSKPIVTKKRKYNGYTIENIALEVLPGVYATGSVYKPHPLPKKAAVILSPNGHFSNGRYGENVQIRCAMLAKIGAVVVSYDLFAWGESQLQFPSTAHRNSIASTMQVINGMRFLDYLLTLKYTDASHVGITGGSGGGSQTMFLSALDDRISVSVPVVMVSAHHSGGCPCESGRGIHLCANGTNNVEIAAMVAPKPQLIISDGGDWTRNVPNLELPFIKRIYGFYAKKNLVESLHLIHEGHNYKMSKRLAMYPFMAKHLNLDISKITDKSGKIDESTCVVEPFEKLFVFGSNGENLPTNAIKDIDMLYTMFGEKNLRTYDVKK